MNARKTHDSLPAELQAVQRRFEEWRQTHRPRSRIPDPLWDAAGRMAGKFGLCRTARALRIEYYALKRRVEQSSADVPGCPEPGPATGFVEWPMPLAVGRCDCTLELEDAAGSKMRIQVTSAALPDLAAISRSFWNPRS